MTDDELAQLGERTRAANAAWMNGDAGGYADLNSHSADFTIMGPFGGPPVRGYAAWHARAPQVARLFRSGTSELELVESYVSGDLAVLVMVEHQCGEIGGTAGQDWSLRVTQVYRREDGGWRVVHRHADPLVRGRSLAETAGLTGTPGSASTG